MGVLPPQHGSHHRRVELPKTDGGEFADEAGEIAEMMRRGGMRHPGVARHRPQRQSGEPIALQHGFRGLQQGVAQRAVVVRGIFGRAGSPRRAWFPPGRASVARFGAGRTRALAVLGFLAMRTL